MQPLTVAEHVWQSIADFLATSSKRSDTYLLTLLIHGGRSVLRHSTAPEAWHNRLVQRRHKNVAAVAIANKNARTVWALLAKDRNDDPLQRLPHAVA